MVKWLSKYQNRQWALFPVRPSHPRIPYKFWFENPMEAPGNRQANNIKMSRKELVCDDAGKYVETLSWITASYFALHDAGSKPSLPVDSE